MPRQNEIALDVVVFVAVFAVTVLVSIVMALVPVAAAARPALQPLLKQNQSTDTPTRRRALGTLVTSQVALAVVLGIGAGLMLRTLWNLQKRRPGFQRRERAHVPPPDNLEADESDDRAWCTSTTCSGAFARCPRSVMSAPSSTCRCLATTGPQACGVPRIRLLVVPQRPQAIWRFTGWDYFRTMGIAMRAGRAFTDQDRLDSPAVAIINESLARREFGSAEAAVRQTPHQLHRGGKEQPVEVAGVVADVRFQSLDKPSEPEMYRPLAQTFMFPMAFVVKTDDSASAREVSAQQARIAAAIRQAAFAVDRDCGRGSCNRCNHL